MRGQGKGLGYSRFTSISGFAYLMPSFIVRPRVHSLGALALALLSLMAAQASANQRTVYKGTLQGAGEVVLELDDAAGADVS